VGPDELPAQVVETWTGILRAAIECDWDALGAVMSAEFTTAPMSPSARSITRGPEQSLAWWREAERSGEPVAARLVEVLLAGWHWSLSASDSSLVQWSRLTEPGTGLVIDAESGEWLMFLGY
jgi:hypothetical protein